MAKFSTNQWIGIVLIIASLLIWTPANFIPYSNNIAALIVIIIGIWQLFI